MAIAAVTQKIPTVVTSATGSATGTTAVSINVPAQVKDGHLLVAIVALKGSGTWQSITPPDTNWQVSNTAAGDATRGLMMVWYKTANGEKGTWTFGKDADAVINIVAVDCYDTRAPIEVRATFNSGTSGTSHTAPAITTLTPNALMITGYSSNTGGGTHTQPTGMTELRDTTISGSVGASMDVLTVVTPGSTGTKNSTGTNTGWCAVSLAIATTPTVVGANYVPSVMLPYYSTDANTLIAIVGANSFGATLDNDCRVSSIIDDAHNVWVEGPTDFAHANSWDPYISGRVSIWYCINAKAVSQITVTMTQTVDALGVQFQELSGVTNVNPIDLSKHGSPGSDQTTITADSSPTSTTVANDYVVIATIVCDSGVTVTWTGTGWTQNPNVSTASPATVKDDVLLRSVWKLAPIATQQTTWSVSAGRRTAWAMLALKPGSTVTTNPNPGWPQVVHQLGFGVDPNDPSSPEVWQDITDRVEEFTFRQGRDYELARTEAGEGDLRVNNSDGALDPTNASSPYSPYVKVFTPYRCVATWNGRTKPLMRGYVERWPLSWENLRGKSRMQIVDGLATLSATRLQGTLSAEILADDPWAYWALDDGALATQAANKATTTSDVLVVSESIYHGGYGYFGTTMTLQSEDSTCWHQSRATADVSDAPNAKYGQCLTAAMGLPQLSDGVSIECWARIANSSPTQNYTLLSLKGTGFSADSAHRIVHLWIDTFNGLPTLDVANSSGAMQTITSAKSALNDDAWHHYVVHCTTSTARLWIDGQLQATLALGSVPSSTIDIVQVGGQVDTYTTVAPEIAEGYFAHVAVFELATVDERRIAQRAYAGLFGFPERTGARLQRLLNYAGWTAARAIDSGQSALGPAATISKQTILQASQDVTSWENGQFFVDPAGLARFMDRATRFGKRTQWIFGDAPGEIPYKTDMVIDYDPQYIYNDVTITRTVTNFQSGQPTGAGSSAHKRDQASIKSYFYRNLDKSTGVASITQCLNEADWVLENYAQPRPRLESITISPSANPDLWEAALTIQIGDRVTVRRRQIGSPNTIDLDCYVEQVSHQTKRNAWDVVYSLSPALLTSYGAQNDWILDASALEVDTIVGKP